MSAYRVAQNTREIRLMEIGVARGMRAQIMGLARATKNPGLARIARICNRDLVRALLALRVRS